MGKIISIMLLGFALAGCSLPEPQYFVGEKTDTEALVDCQGKIREQLKIPKSMKPESFGAIYIAPPEKPNHEILFQFYAQNSFGGEVFNTARCTFDDKGNVIKAEFEQNV